MQEAHGFGASGPYDLDAFTRANMSPNATGSADLQAKNLHGTGYAGFNVMWTASLNITEVTNLNYTSHPAADVITNSVISLNSHGIWANESDSGLQVQLVVFPDLPRSVTVNGQKDTGDCVTTLGEECLKDYNQLISEHITRSEDAFRSGSNVTATATHPSPPKSCKDYLGGENVSGQLGSNFVDGSPQFYSSSTVHDANNLTAYELATTRIWPMFLIQTATGVGGLTVRDSEASKQHLTCLRANGTAEGSIKIGKVPSGTTRYQINACGFVAICFASLVGEILW
ncbi:hypothetical protein BJ875DRAFT_377884 [Amylocarpus encephaloides]|uniref:Uncharacterized protein n=1 Tax=Amylocarpus encephaloides TaxID=45428 RepID=A0A9P7YIN6_9HELO|nr:hypothetical protein BJ875DRAFT_377884 [Amylocarpus encephaloides]